MSAAYQPMRPFALGVHEKPRLVSVLSARPAYAYANIDSTRHRNRVTPGRSSIIIIIIIINADGTSDTRGVRLLENNNVSIVIVLPRGWGESNYAA